ncbi:MAG: tRNA dihydrouridine(20/20a) synthase DusA [Gammaproteobacteria bacterium HGW-Gammaproteobacteria-2]|jgi:tRNA-dihydrouridine synthase A|nr:MAG: tRNA dihydrouridine(20/20a) synthase DusA [Gammaproteobacteria bacterium HGW-Gammaproteobacteria-2]
MTISPQLSARSAMSHRYDASIRLSVAPMMDWTDRHCRAFHRILAPQARLYTEMVHAQAVLHGDRERLIGYDAAEHPLALQLGGSDPQLLAQAARIGAEWGYDEINLNVGCPSDRVQAGRFGACLMKEPALVADCVAAMVAAVPVPVSVKCRLGVDDADDYAQFRGFIDTVAQAGCRVFVVHARNAWLKGLSPKENREVPPLRYEWAHRLKRERPDLSVVLNGGIDTLEKIADNLPLVDGVMIGRAAYHMPYALHQMQQRVFTPGQPLRDRADLLRAFQPYVEKQLVQGVALKYMARHVLGLYNAQPGGRHFRQILSQGFTDREAGWELVEAAIAATTYCRAAA